MHYVQEASYVGGYQLKIRSENDEVRVVDLSDHLDGPMTPISLLIFCTRSEKASANICIQPTPCDGSADAGVRRQYGRKENGASLILAREISDAPFPSLVVFFGN